MAANLTARVRDRVGTALAGLALTLGGTACHQAGGAGKALPSLDGGPVPVSPEGDSPDARGPVSQRLDCFGFDLAALRDACGWGEGRLHQLASGCRVEFGEHGGEPVMVTIDSRAPLTVEEAMQIHLESFFVDDGLQVDPGSFLGGRLTSWQGHSWTILPGPRFALRVHWPTTACPLQEVATGLKDLSATFEPDLERVRLEGIGTHRSLPPRDPPSLLHAYEARDLGDLPVGYSLPYYGPRLVRDFFVLVAKDDMTDISRYVSDRARWGVPLSSEAEARPVFAGDDGTHFFAAFRDAALRVDDDVRQSGAMVYRYCEEGLRSGSAPLWVWYERDRDGLLFRIQTLEGLARIDYVGFFESGRREMFEGEYPPPQVRPTSCVNEGTLYVPSERTNRGYQDWKALPWEDAPPWVAERHGR